MANALTIRKRINRPSLKVERSTWEIGASLDFESSKAGATGKDVDLMVNKQGPAPVYLTVESAFPAYIGLPSKNKILLDTCRSKLY